MTRAKVSSPHDEYCTRQTTDSCAHARLQTTVRVYTAAEGTGMGGQGTPTHTRDRAVCAHTETAEPAPSGNWPCYCTLPESSRARGGSHFPCPSLSGSSWMRKPSNPLGICKSPACSWLQLPPWLLRCPRSPCTLAPQTTVCTKARDQASVALRAQKGQRMPAPACGTRRGMHRRNDLARC